jgi:hypothetical protein
MNTVSKSYRPRFDALEDRFMPSTALTTGMIASVSKPMATAAQSSASTLDGQDRGRENGIIAILIG